MTTEPEVFELLRKIRYDATAIQAKVTDALTMLANMNLPTDRSDEFTCLCGLSFATARRLALHIQNVHDGPPVPLEENEIHA